MSDNIENPINLFGLDSIDDEIASFTGSNDENNEEEFDTLKEYDRILKKLQDQNKDEPNSSNEDQNNSFNSFGGNSFRDPSDPINSFGSFNSLDQSNQRRVSSPPPSRSNSQTDMYDEEAGEIIFNNRDSNNSNNSNNSNVYNKGISSYNYNEDDDLDNMINDYSGVSNEQEKTQTYEENITDKKLVYIENIQFLRETLTQQDVNLDNVPVVDYNSSLNEIEFAYRILMIKNNRDINIEATNNIIIGGIRVMEKIFNGERSFGGFKPDITGYSNTADITLRRLNLETEKIGSTFLNKEGSHPYYKIAMVLVPGMIAHSLTRQKRSNDSIYNKKDLSDALNEIDRIGM